MEGENPLSAGINWIYGRNEAKKQIDYYLYFNPQRIPKELGDLVKDKPLHVGHQIGDFSGDQLHLLAFYYSPPGCLKLLDPSFKESNLQVPDFVSEASALSEPELISPEISPQNREHLYQLFGEEPTHTWCFYFEQAELARQYKNWNEISTFYTQVLDKGLKPAVMEEWFPFIEGLANLQDWQKAMDISRVITMNSKSDQSVLCSLWSRIIDQIKPTGKDQNLTQTYFSSELNCPSN